MRLDLSSAHLLSDLGLANLGPHVSELALNGRNLTDRSFGLLGPHLIRLKLFEAPQITEEGFLKFFERNKHLNRLVLEGCPNLTDRVLAALQRHPLEQLWIFGPSQITDSGAAHLRSLPLRSLKLSIEIYR
jgi:hypothetical protein